MSKHIWWDWQPGQIEPGRISVAGYTTRDAAEKDAAGVTAEYRPVEVKQLLTWEHDLPADDPAFHPDQRRAGQRWAVIMRDLWAEQAAEERGA
jgi:hypothetical protein